MQIFENLMTLQFPHVVTTLIKNRVHVIHFVLHSIKRQVILQSWFINHLYKKFCQLDYIATANQSSPQYKSAYIAYTVRAIKIYVTMIYDIHIASTCWVVVTKTKVT